MAFNLEKYFVIRDCTQDVNYLENDFSKACSKARDIACKHFGNKWVLIPCIIYYKENSIPKYVGICKARNQDGVQITWWNASDNLIYALQNGIIECKDDSGTKVIPK